MSTVSQPIQLPMRLNASKKKWLLLLIVSLAFAIVGYFMVRSRAEYGWMVFIFFGVGVIVAAVCMLPNASYLVLAEEGFTITSLFRSSFTSWKSVESFGLLNTAGNRMVAFTYRSDANVSKVARTIATGIANGAEGALPDTYGMRIEDLRALMSRLHERYGK